jgi:hypothetical protein
VKPFVPEHLLPQSYGLADLALITMRNGFEGTIVPSKLLGHMARGIPTLYIGPGSDISHYIEESKGGLCFQKGDVQGVVDFLKEGMVYPERLRLAGENAKEYYETHLGMENALSAYMRTILQVLAEKASRLAPISYDGSEASSEENR